MVSNWPSREFARARWWPLYLGIPIGKEVWGYPSHTERKPESSIPLKNPKNTASSTEPACSLPKTMWRSSTRVTSSWNQKSISMITGVAPPDRLDKLESIWCQRTDFLLENWTANFSDYSYLTIGSDNAVLVETHQPRLFSSEEFDAGSLLLS